MTGRKDDAGKRPWSLLPWSQVGRIVDVLAFGATKYGAGNWQHVPNLRQRYFDAAQRHLIDWFGGQELDQESGLPHLAHACCCLLFLLWNDDQFTGVKS